MNNPAILVSTPSNNFSSGLHLEVGCFVHVRNPNPTEAPLEGYILGLDQSRAVVEVCRYNYGATSLQALESHLSPIPRLPDGHLVPENELRHPCGHLKPGVRCETVDTSRPTDKWIVQVIPPEGNTRALCLCGSLQAPNRYKVRRQRPFVPHIENFPVTVSPNKAGFVNPRLTPIALSQIFHTQYWDDRLQQSLLPTPASVVCSLVDSGIGLSPATLPPLLPRTASPPITDTDEGSGTAHQSSRESSMDSEVVLYPRSPKKESLLLQNEQGAHVEGSTLLQPQVTQPYQHKRTTWHRSTHSADSVEDWRRGAPSNPADALLLFRSARKQPERQYQI